MGLEERKGVFYKLKAKYLVIIYLFGFVFCLALKKYSCCDIWWHLRTGQYIVSQKIFPFCNTFSHTALFHPWIAYSWLTEIIFYYVSILGFNWLILLKTCLIIITFMVVLKTTYLASNKNFNLSVLITLFMMHVSSGSWLLRPQLFSFLFTAFFVYILNKFEYDNDTKILWFIPLIMLFWVNLHIYFVVGLFLIFIYLFCSVFKGWFLFGENEESEIKKQRLLLKITLISLFVCFINPYTYRIFIEVLRLTGQQWARSNISELQSLNFHCNRVFLFEIMFFILIFSLSVAKKRPSLITIILFITFTYQALYSVRDLPFWAIVMAPIIGRHLGDFFIELKGNQNFVEDETLIDLSQKSPFGEQRIYFLTNWVLLGALIVTIVSFFPRDAKLESCVNMKDFPVGAVTFIKENRLPGKMFNSFNWGGYLIYSLYPEWKVFVDGRTQAYGDEFLTECSDIWSLSLGWEKKFKKHEVNFVLWPRKLPLTEVFLLMNNWKLIYFDDIAVIFIRDIPQNRVFINKYEKKVKEKIKKEESKQVEG